MTAPVIIAVSITLFAWGCPCSVGSSGDLICTYRLVETSCGFSLVVKHCVTERNGIVLIAFRDCCGQWRSVLCWWNF